MNVSQVRSSTVAAALAVTLLSMPAGTLPGAERERALSIGRGGNAPSFGFGRREDSGTDVFAGAVTSSSEPEGFSTSDQEIRTAKLSRRAAAQTARIQDELERYRELGEDWDDAGAEAPSETALASAIAFARWTSMLGAVPKRSYASPGGDVGLVWERDDGYADVGFYEDGTVSFYIRNRTGDEEVHSDERISLAAVSPETWALLITL